MNAYKRFQYASRGDGCVPRAYIVQNRFKVLPGYRDKFESAWMMRKSYLHEMPGYISFSLLRNDDLGKNEYISQTVWQDKESFDIWLASPQFKKSKSAYEDSNASAPKPPRGPPESRNACVTPRHAQENSEKTIASITKAIQGQRKNPADASALRPRAPQTRRAYKDSNASAPP